jgi:hypothetical protein
MSTLQIFIICLTVIIVVLAIGAILDNWQNNKHRDPESRDDQWGDPTHYG